MPRIRQILAQKGSKVLTIEPQSRVIDAALRMNEHKIGALVVLRDERIVGIISERDMMRRVLAKRCDPDQTTVEAVMTSPVVTCSPDTPIEQAREIFRSRRIRHLPVVDPQGHLQGMISIGDLNAWELNGQEIVIHHLQEYLYGAA